MIPALGETQKLWHGIPAERRSRSLALERIVHFGDGDAGKAEARRTSCEAVATARPGWDKGAHWLTFLRCDLKLRPQDLLFGELKSRLLLDMAGGVIENGHLAIDRHSGVPVIAGSAVKGCARRMALQRILALANDPRTEDETLIEAMSDVALVFGWTQQEWTDGRNRNGEFVSDFVWACGNRWSSIADPLKETLNARLAARDPRPGGLPLARAGSVAFLPAYPVRTIPHDIELDVLTSHHPNYYKGDPAFASAPDIEDPNPVVFPAVAPGHTFVFAVIANRPGAEESALTEKARRWLADGLTMFGLGAKTAAGYGWFATDETIQNEAAERITRQENAEKRRLEEAAQAEEQARKSRERQEEKALLAQMSPEERHAFELGKLSDDQFRSKLDKFDKLDADERKAVVRALAGDGSAHWENIKQTAQTGPAKKRKRARALEQELRKVSKQLGGILK